MSEPAKQIGYLAAALKAPRIGEAAVRLAVQARDAGWTHEDYLIAVLDREVAARNASGAQQRIRAAGFEMNGARAQGQRPALDLHPPDDHFGRADDLSDLNDRRLTEERIRRQVQLIVGTRACPARDGSKAAGVHVVGDEHRGRVAQPIAAAIVRGRFERHDENPAGLERRNAADRRSLTPHGRWRKAGA